MSDILIIIFALLTALFFGTVSVLFFKDVFFTAKAKLQKDKNITKLGRRQILIHIFAGGLAGAFALLFLSVVLFGYILRSGPPADKTESRSSAVTVRTMSSRTQTT
jgi:hypothetical protein